MPQNEKMSLQELRKKFSKQLDDASCPICKNAENSYSPEISQKLVDVAYSILMRLISKVGRTDNYTSRECNYEFFIKDELKKHIDKTLLEFQIKVHKESYKVGFADGKIDVLNSLEISPENYDLSTGLRKFKE